MKKILLFIQLFIAVCLTACYTNVITDYEGEGDGGGGGNPSNQFITLSDPAQLNQTAYADSLPPARSLLPPPLRGRVISKTMKPAPGLP